MDGRPRTVGDLLKGEFEEMSESSTHSNRKRSGRLSCKLDDDLLEEIGIGDSDHARSCLGLGSAPASYQTRIFDGKSMLLNRVAEDPTEMPGHVVPFAVRIKNTAVIGKPYSSLLGSFYDCSWIQPENQINDHYRNGY